MHARAGEVQVRRRSRPTQAEEHKKTWIRSNWSKQQVGRQKWTLSCSALSVLKEYERSLVSGSRDTAVFDETWTGRNTPNESSLLNGYLRGAEDTED